MATRKIREIGDPVLTKQCKEVTEIIECKAVMQILVYGGIRNDYYE